MSETQSSGSPPLPSLTVTSAPPPEVVVHRTDGTFHILRKIAAGAALVVAGVKAAHGLDPWPLFGGFLVSWFIWPTATDYFSSRTATTTVRNGSGATFVTSAAPADHSNYWHLAYRNGGLEVQNGDNETVVNQARLCSLAGLGEPRERADYGRILRLAQEIADRHNEAAGYDVPKSE